MQYNNSRNQIKKCWVGDSHKICYADEYEAEMAARLVEQEHQLAGGFLHSYKCSYGEHWHLASKNQI